jgi:curved DNA-binding protein CbpA
MILGISSEASAEDIKSAYRQKAIQFHPDHNPDKAATEMFKRLTEAYNALMGVTSVKRETSQSRPTQSKYESYDEEKEQDYDYDDGWVKGKRWNPNQSSSKKKHYEKYTQPNEPTATLACKASVGSFHRDLYRNRLLALRANLKDFDPKGTMTWDEDWRTLISYFSIKIVTKESLCRAFDKVMKSWV